MKKPHPLTPSIQTPSGYAEFLTELKHRIRSAQLKAAVSVNRELVLLYWDIGRQIVERQDREKWGTHVISRLSQDLKKEFPGVEGFSGGNLWRMRAFYLAYSQGFPILAQAVRELPKPLQVLSALPWGHNVLLVEKVKNPIERLWYAQKAVENGWSRSVLWHQIDTKLYHRQGKSKKIANFPKVLPPAQSDLALEMMKDPYNFDFLTLAEEAHERLWRSVKYENVYLKGYETIPEAEAGLREYFDFYNTERRHQSLGYKTPWRVYSGLEVGQNQNLAA